MPTAKARPPSVIRLIVLTRQPKPNHGRHQGERNIQHDDQHASPIAQEEEHHQSGQPGSEQPLDRQTADGARDIWGLIELEADLNVVGQARPASWSDCASLR